MSFARANFNPLGGQSKRGKAPQRFSYSTLDSHATVDTSGYFNDASFELQAGDIIDVVVWATAIGTGGTVSTYGKHIVLTNASGVVDVSNVTVGVVTDAD